MVSFPTVSPPRPYTLPFPPPYAPHAQPFSFISILLPAQYRVSSTNHLAHVMQSPPFPRYLDPPRSKYSPQHHVLKHPQLSFLPQCQRPSFTPIQNNRQNYNSPHQKIWWLRALCSLTGTFINTPGTLLMVKLTTGLTTY